MSSPSRDALDPPELPYSDPAYVEMWDRVAAEWRERNSFVHMRDGGRSRSSIMTADDLQKQLDYLSGFPEAQRAAIEAFKERQAETKPTSRRDRRGRGKTRRQNGNKSEPADLAGNEADLAAIAARLGVAR